jgi:hypothetical protein
MPDPENIISKDYGENYAALGSEQPIVEPLTLTQTLIPKYSIQGHTHVVIRYYAHCPFPSHPPTHYRINGLGKRVFNFLLLCLRKDLCTLKVL